MNFQHKVEMWDIGKIKPYSQNAKTHPPEQIEKLANAMTEFGMDVPIVVDGNGTIIKGHGRRLAAIKLGLKQFSVIVRTDLTPVQVKAARLADNRISQTSWDNELLSTEMGALYEEDFDLAKMGFDPGEIANLFGIELDSPNFDPASIDDQGKLDEKKKVCCPGCGHEFTP